MSSSVRGTNNVHSKIEMAPQGVADAAFIQTIPDRNFLATLRLYGTEDGFYDQTWKPDDLVKVK